jgi:hypothetical protein
MPWVSIIAIVCGLLMEIYTSKAQFEMFRKGDEPTKERMNMFAILFSPFFFFVLLLEDLPQIAVVVGYRAYSPKDPGTYDYYLEIIAFMTSNLSIISKATAAAWIEYKDEHTSNTHLMFTHFMFLYMFPLFGVFAAAFLNSTNVGLTYTALGMSLVPQILALVYLLPRICNCIFPCIDQRYLAAGCCFWPIYNKILQPMRFFWLIENYVVIPVNKAKNRLAEKLNPIVQPCLDGLENCLCKCLKGHNWKQKMSRHDMRELSKSL